MADPKIKAFEKMARELFKAYADTYAKTPNAQASAAETLKTSLDEIIKEGFEVDLPALRTQYQTSPIKQLIKQLEEPSPTWTNDKNKAFKQFVAERANPNIPPLDFKTATQNSTNQIFASTSEIQMSLSLYDKGVQSRIDDITKAVKNKADATTMSKLYDEASWLLRHSFVPLMLGVATFASTAAYMMLAEPASITQLIGESPKAAQLFCALCGILVFGASLGVRRFMKPDELETIITERARTLSNRAETLQEHVERGLKDTTLSK